jgi:hypothetical protein
MPYFITLFFAGLYFVSTTFKSQNNCSLRPDQINTTSNSPVSKISYTSSGGKGGYYETLDITSASLTYVQGHRGVEKAINEKTLNSFWDKLTKTVNLEDFDKIKSDPGHALYDGIDITISIEKGKEKHSIVNGNEDSVNYRKIKPFTDLLENKLAEIRKKIVWQK